MTKRNSWWLAVVETYPCPVCGAGPGSPCHTVSGNAKAEPHADRTRLQDRCPVCGSRLPADAELGEACARCQKVRELELERSTTWKRLHP